mmetsp:Transcript_52324/g.162412  ORF Transcript_52324/g.162412 Transcript_52324/m.162412 type:complete len:230 (+) Transcript_52324:809-1498(+)
MPSTYLTDLVNRVKRPSHCRPCRAAHVERLPSALLCSHNLLLQRCRLHSSLLVRRHSDHLIRPHPRDHGSLGDRVVSMGRSEDNRFVVAPPAMLPHMREVLVPRNYQRHHVRVRASGGKDAVDMLLKPQHPPQLLDHLPLQHGEEGSCPVRVDGGVQHSTEQLCHLPCRVAASIELVHEARVTRSDAVLHRASASLDKFLHRSLLRQPHVHLLLQLRWRPELQHLVLVC